MGPPKCLHLSWLMISLQYWDCFLLNEAICLPGVFIDSQIFSHSCSSRLSKSHFLSFHVWFIFIHFPTSSWKLSEPAPLSIISFANWWRGRPKQSTGRLCYWKSAKTEMRLSIPLCRGILRGLTCPAVCSQGWVHFPCTPDQNPSLHCCAPPFSKGSGETWKFSCTSCGCGALLSPCRRLTVSMEKPSINIEAYQLFTALWHINISDRSEHQRSVTFANRSWLILPL